jgi:hypothetical protein
MIKLLSYTYDMFFILIGLAVRIPLLPLVVFAVLKGNYGVEVRQDSSDIGDAPFEDRIKMNK